MSAGELISENAVREGDLLVRGVSTDFLRGVVRDTLGQLERSELEAGGQLTASIVLGEYIRQLENTVKALNRSVAAYQDWQRKAAIP